MTSVTFVYLDFSWGFGVVIVCKTSADEKIKQTFYGKGELPDKFMFKKK